MLPIPLPLTTTRHDGTQPRWTPIWVVRVGDDLYIRSAGGRTSDWYRHATARDAARVRADGVEADVAVRPVEDPAVAAQVTAAYQAKYQDQGGLLDLFLKTPAIEATLHIDRLPQPGGILGSRDGSER